MTLRATRILLIALLALEVVLWCAGPQPKNHLPGIQAATEAGKRPDWWDDAALGIHFAAAINGALLVMMLVTATWWARPLLRSGFRVQGSGMENDDVEDVVPARAMRYFWPLMGCAVLMCVGLRLPLASKSLWWDEAWVIQQVSHGKWKEDAKHPDKMKFQAHDWARCAWYYQKPTNHAPMSLLQKASIIVWQKLTHAKRDEFSDLAARVPSLLASCAAVLLMGCLLRAWGSAGAGVAGAFLLAMHPWAIRYGVDARAYALVMPLCLAGMLAITRVVETRGTKIWPWAGWGIIEFVWLWAYPNALLDIAALNLVVAVLLWRKSEGDERWIAMRHLVATNVFAAMCLIQVFLPNLMQARHWAGQEADKHLLNLDLASSTLSQLMMGTDYWQHGAQDAAIPAFITSKTPPSSLDELVFCSGVVLLLGAVQGLLLRARSRLHPAVLVLLALTLASALFAALTEVLGGYFYARFVIAVLPVTIVSICLVLAQARMRAILLPLLVVTGAALFWKADSFLMTRPYAPLHEVASFIREDTAKDKTAPLVICYGLGREVLPVYYPAAQPAQNLADLEQAATKAKAEQRPLYFIYGYNNFNRTMLPDGFTLLDDKARCEERKVLGGIEPEFTFRVLRGQ